MILRALFFLCITLCSSTHIAAQEEQEATLSLNFENASLLSVVNYLKEQKGIDLFPHKDLANVKVSFTSKTPQTLDEAWDTLYTLLEANGFTIIKVNEQYRVISMKDHQRSPLPCSSSSQGVMPEDLPDTDEIGRYIYFCRNMPVRAAKSILDSILAQNAVQINNTLGACIITDKYLHIKSAMRIITELDQGGLRQALRMLPLTHANAESVHQLFSQIIGSQPQQKNKIRFASNSNEKSASYFSGDTKIIPETTHNQLIVMGTEESIDKVADFIKKYIDVPVESAKSRLHIKEIKYMAAEKLKALLERLLAPGNGKSLIEGEFKYFEDVILAAESPRDGNAGDGGTRGSGNRLIVSCNSEDWVRLEQFIDRLDKPQPQIAIEVLIVDLQHDDVRALGTQLRSKNNIFGDSITAQASNLAAPSSSIGGDLTSTAGALDGSSILTLGKQGDVWAVLRTICNSDRSDVLSQPYLVTNNNAPCREEFVVERYTNGAFSGGSNSGLSTARINRVPVRAAISTDITPRINGTGVIDLHIKITVNEFKDNTGSSPDKTDRTVETRALVGSGEVLVIGGLTDNKNTTENWKTPLLGDLPIIGTLFRGDSVTKLKKNLYVFLRPSVLKPHFEGRPDDYTQFKLDYAKYQVLRNDPYRKSKDPIQRWFFKPKDQTIQEKMSDIKNGRVRTLDAFIEGKTTPIQVQISRDPYFKADTTTQGPDLVFHSFNKNGYQPESFNVSMPNIDPSTYQTPGLIEASEPEQKPVSLEHLKSRSLTIGAPRARHLSNKTTQALTKGF